MCWQGSSLSVLFIEWHQCYLPMLWRGQQPVLLHVVHLVNIFIESKCQSGIILEPAGYSTIIRGERDRERERERDGMINFFCSDCDENQSEISDSSDFIVFPNIKWISS